METFTLTEHQKQLAKQVPTNVRQVNAFIRGIVGSDPELVNGNGYFYFASLIPFESSVYVNSVKQMTYREWLNEYFSLKTEGEGQ